MEQLLQGGRRHGAAPDKSVIGRDEKTYRGDFDASGFGRQDVLLFVAENCLRRISFNAEHLRHGGSVDIRIEYSDAVTHVAQRYGQVGRDGRFADSSLAGGDCEDMPYASRGGYFLFYGRCRSLFLFRNGYLAGQFGECSGHCRCYLPFDGVGERVAPFAEGEGDDCILSVGRDMLDDTR